MIRIAENIQPVRPPAVSLEGGPIDWIANWIVPSKGVAIPMAIGGAFLIAFGSQERFKGTAARWPLFGAGGILLGFGVLPFIMDIARTGGKQ